jgi:hypothetical protein
LTVAYDPQTWSNGESGGTPLSATRLNHIESGIDDADTRLATVEAGLAGKADTADLATVATSGSYNDLVDQPSIPAAYTDEQTRDAVAAALVAGSNVTITPDDAGNTITIAASDGGVPATRTITAGTGLVGGGDLSADRTLAVEHPVVALTQAAYDGLGTPDTNTLYVITD